MLIHYLISRFTLPLILACLVSILAPCTVSAAQDAIPQSLKAQLDATSEGFSRRMPPEVSRNIEAAINDLTATGVLDRALKKGDHAPDFTLPDAAGNMVNLASLLKQGPVVLTWYRGNW